MLDEGNTPNTTETPEPPPPEEKSNRTFLIVGGVMAGLVFLTLVCMAVYFLVIAPKLSAQRLAQQSTIEAGNSQISQQLTATAQAAQWTPTVKATTPPLKTSTSLPVLPTLSPTPVIANPQGGAATATNDPATLVAMQTVLAAQLTSTANAQATIAAGQGMPTTGFFDQVGLPSMIVLALALVAVIFLARRMRKSTIR